MAGRWLIDPDRPDRVVEEGAGPGGSPGLVAACETVEDARQIVADHGLREALVRLIRDWRTRPGDGADLCAAEMERLLAAPTPRGRMVAWRGEPVEVVATDPRDTVRTR